MVLLAAALLFASGARAQNAADEFTAAYKRGDYASAFLIAKRLADQGNNFARYNLGVMYMNGQGTAKDYDAAIRAFESARGEGLYSQAQNAILEVEYLKQKEAAAKAAPAPPSAGQSDDFIAVENLMSNMADDQAKSSPPAETPSGKTLSRCRGKAEMDTPEDAFSLLFTEGPDQGNSYAGPPPIPAGEYTAFRGLALGLEEAKISTSLPNQVVAKDCFLLNNDKSCGSYQVGSDGRIVGLRLYTCFFNADDASFDDFAQSIVNSYGIASAREELFKFGSVPYVCYKGTTQHREVVEICEFPLDATRSRIGLRVRPPGNPQAPSFE